MEYQCTTETNVRIFFDDRDMKWLAKDQERWSLIMMGVKYLIDKQLWRELQDPDRRVERELNHMFRVHVGHASAICTDQLAYNLVLFAKATFPRVKT